MTDHGEQQVDQKFLDKQSRTIGTYGLETMTKLISFKVLIVGCGGVGIEAAKNLALAGIHTISLYDSRRPVRSDMGVNFAITEASLNSGKNVAEITAAYIAELNPNTRVRAIEELTQPLVSQHTALIFTTAAPDLSIETLNQWNRFCRSHTPCISFVLALQLGVAGSVFVDHGSNFVVKDPDGRPMLQKSITEVTTLLDKTKEEYTRIRFEAPEGQTPGALRDYTQIKFTEVEGLTKKDGTSINNHVFEGVVCPSDPRNTVRVYPSFRQQGYSAYVTGGFIHELKETIPLSFRTFQDSLTAPGRFVPVSPMMDNSEESQTHLFVHAVLRFADAHKGRLPSLHKVADAHALVAFAKAIIEENKKMLHPTDTSAASAPCKSEFPFRMSLPPPPAPLVVDVINEESIRTQGMIAAVELQPLSSFFGAVVAQEVVKITGKYTPIHQWFHLAAETVLPAKAAYGTEEFTPTGSRYDSIVSIFGKSFQQKLENLRIFMVGCGALGCENIKNFALCGISCGQQGSLVVTDNDRIEISNLSRQFLFREDNVGQPKSVAAAARMRQMNPKCNVDARQDFVGTVSEHLFPDSFWQGLDVVVNALDNMEARLYVDQQCVRFNKVLVEAGTMGTGGNVDIIVPHKTSSYADGGAADQTGGIPMCTLRNFPYIYDHCIEWARATFDDLFVSPMQSAYQIIEDQHAYVNRITQEVGAAQSDGERRSLIEKHIGPLKNVKGTLSTIAEGCTMDKCAQLAFEVIFKLFRDRIYDLQKSFPKDAKKKNGEPFWSGHRKYPTALEMDVGTVLSNPDGTNFLISCINLYACMFGLHPPKPEAQFNDAKHRWMSQYRSVDWLKTQLSKLSVPTYVPGSVEGLDDDAAADACTKDAVSVSQLQMELDGLLKDVTALASRCRKSKAIPLEFEKDDDDNFQIDFIAAASNLRAKNYIIPTQDRMMVKLVAGKIIPAIATTTSAVTGLSLIEFFKVLQGKDVSSLRNGMLDVGTNNYVLFERDSPITYHTKVISTYLPEQDYTYKKKVIRIPEGYTKYDTIKIDVTQKTTVQQFADSLAAYLNGTLPAGAAYAYEVDGVGVGKGLIWNGRKTHSNTNVPIMDAIEKQKVAESNGSQGKPFWENRKQFFDLSVTISVDDGEEGIDEEDVETATICLCIK